MNVGNHHARIAALSATERRELYQVLREQEGVCPIVERHDHLAACYTGEALSEKELKEFIGARLPEFMVPARVIRLDAMPRTSNGKTDKDGLRILEAAEPVATKVPVESPLTGRILSVWEELLRREGIQPDDNFFDLGGHSLLVLKCVNRINEIPGCDITPSQFFQAPSVSGILSLIGTQTDASPFEFLYPIREGGDGPPVFVIYSPRLARGLTRHLENEFPCYGLRMARVDEDGVKKTYPDLTGMVRQMVQEIQRVSPSGDVVLCGYSFGAVLAYEAAQQLQDAGRRPRRLVLLDPTPPFRKHPSSRKSSAAGESSRAGSSISRWLVTNSPLKPLFWQKVHDLLIVKPRRFILLNQARNRLSRKQALSARMAAAYDMHLFYALWREYTLRTYDGPTTLFHAMDAQQDATRAWRGYLPEHTKIHRVEGDHIEFMAGERSEELVRLFSEDL